MLGFSGTKLGSLPSFTALASVKTRVFRNQGFKLSGFQEPKVGLNGFSGTKNGLLGTIFGFLGTSKRVIRNADIGFSRTEVSGFQEPDRHQNP